MIITTTQGIEGKTIHKYRGVILGTGVTPRVGPGKIFPRDSDYTSAYQAHLDAARASAIGQLEIQAKAAGGNAVVGVSVEVELVRMNAMYLAIVTATGTAVVVD